MKGGVSKLDLHKIYEIKTGEIYFIFLPSCFSWVRCCSNSSSSVRRLAWLSLVILNGVEPLGGSTVGVGVAGGRAVGGPAGLGAEGGVATAGGVAAVGGGGGGIRAGPPKHTFTEACSRTSFQIIPFPMCLGRLQGLTVLQSLSQCFWEQQPHCAEDMVQ